jgi:flagellar biogenesis protein FliO
MEADAASQLASLPQPPWVAALKNLWQWVRRIVKVRKVRRLRVCETLSLGDRRFVAVIEFNGQEFLVGGSGNSFELLARLHGGKVIAEPSPSREAQTSKDLGALS